MGLIAMLLTVSLATAAPLPQTDQPGPTPIPTLAPATALQVQACRACHEGTTDSWQSSPHAHAYDDPVFQERWAALSNPSDCLVCHTTNYNATTGQYDAIGISCEACHGEVNPQHPLVPAQIKSDTEYCGSCHTTTLAEWRLSGHAAATVGCTDCHDPHSQATLFQNPDELCLNCHQGSMGPYLEDIHVQKGIGCVDCHALVIPPAVPPVDGIVPTGHTFTITPATCVACHTDALHAGFSLPGFEGGAAAHGAVTAPDQTDNAQTQTGLDTTGNTRRTPQEEIQNLQTKVSTLEAANASRNLTILFQGAVVGLVLGGSTAWLVANNMRQARRREDEVDDD
jgi:predicted CXXCH cytochrome family protein